MAETRKTEFELPAGFEDLRAYRKWALHTERERSDQRQSSSVAEIETFYHAMTARIGDVFTLLDTLPLDRMTPAEENLLLLTLGLQEVAIVVENYRSVAVPDGWDVRDIEMNVVGGTY